MSARDEILAGIRSRLGRKSASAARVAELERGLADPRPRVVPARAEGNAAELAARFVEMAEFSAATVDLLAGMEDVPNAIARFLASHNLPARLVAAPALDDIDWSKAPALEVRFDTARPEDVVGVTRAYAGVAETGTLVQRSGPDTPTGINFLPETHVIVLRKSDLVGGYEKVWERLRRDGALPRTVNLITGPSRTGDIEQQILVGVHGPRRLHVLLVEA
jgi:L-lactate dehydrogenase complex protein LldG